MGGTNSSTSTPATGTANLFGGSGGYIITIATTPSGSPWCNGSGGKYGGGGGGFMHYANGLAATNIQNSAGGIGMVALFWTDGY